MAKYHEANNTPHYRSNSQQPTRELTDPSETPALSRARALHHKIAAFRTDFQPLHDRVRILFSQDSVRQQHNLWRHMGMTTLIHFGKEQFEVPTYRGIQYWDILVHFPGQEFHPLELISRVDGGTLSHPITAGYLPQENVSISFGGAKLEVLEEEELKRYKKMAHDLQEQIEEAKLLGKEEEIERIQIEMEWITKEIKRARRPGGKSRTTPDNASRAVNSVPRAIRRCIGKIRIRSPLLADHLDASLSKTMGSQCTYRPSPGTPPWDY